MIESRSPKSGTGKFPFEVYTAISLLPLTVSGCINDRAARHGSESRLPNVVLINADDIGYGDLSCYGATVINTPNIDLLAQQGCMYTDFHAASAVSTPSRYALLTGCYPARIDQYAPVFLRSPLIIDTAQLTVARVMKEAGYSTAVIGKWHLGFGNQEPADWNRELKPGPLELGFDYYFGIPVVSSAPPFVYVENHSVVGYDAGDPFVYGERAVTDSFPEKSDYSAIGGARAAHALYHDRLAGTTIKDTAVSWIRKNKDRPFFLYLATTNIHHPFTPAPQFIGKSKAGRYGDCILELDWIVGEVMKTLDEEGVTDNTMVIFTSDNGGMLNQGGQDAWRAGHHMNGDLLGFKFDAWEGGNRVPFIVRWPGKIKGGSRSDELLSNVDILATLASLVGHELKEGEAPDSYNALPALLGRQDKPVRDFLVISPRHKENLAIRKGKWVYISAQEGGGFDGTAIGDGRLGGAAAFLLTGQQNSDIENGKVKPGAPPAQLYDLENDPSQTTNLYYKYPDVVSELQELLSKAIYTQTATRPE
jgi:arylsulfatase A-like enzyme